MSRDLVVRRWCAVAMLAAAAPAIAQAPRTVPADAVEIEAGGYRIGSDRGPADERPAHVVMLEAFSIDRHEVTNAQFAAFLEAMRAERAREIRILADSAPGRASERTLGGAGAVHLMENTRQHDRRTWVALNDAESRIGTGSGRFLVEPGFEHHPVNEVTWHGARAYCAWRGARLPTEAEWEAAAGGRDGRSYPWGEDAPSPRHAVFGRRSNDTAPVGGRPMGATPQGVHDLAGNVAEWTSSLYRPYPYRRDDGREDPDAPGERVTRGGDHVFDATPEKIRTTFRAGFSRAPAVGHRHIGFRCAK